MRILYYNWVDYLDDEARGGGVSVYQKNVMAGLAGREGVETGFLAAGLTYDLPPGRAPRWERMRHGPKEDRDRRYDLVNSGTLAPAHHSFGDPSQISHPATEAAFCDMVAATGPWDVVHFNNLEGVPANVMAALKARFPETRIVVALHNYYPVCPQVNLWQRESRHCDDFLGGAACTGCLLHQPSARLVRAAHGVAYRLKRVGVRPGTRAFDLLFTNAMRAGQRASRLVGALRRRLRRAAPPPRIEGPSERVEAVPREAAAEGPGNAFAARRAEMVALLNTHADRVLGVSERVSRIAADHGVDPARIRTSYIGTREAAKFAATAPRGPLPPEGRPLHLAYLGYMRRDKGFFFLLDALDAMDADLARRLHLTVAARTGPAEAMARMRATGARLGGLTHHDGYTHAGLDTLLADVDAGLVPVLWEDNLPQVAIEMHARHIPLLTSDRGGARELANCPDMVFRAGDAESFAERIAALLEGRIDMDAYWAGARAPTSMEAHLDQLLEIYAGRD
ncbi:glycosyltransferase involved in cell wall biosynthesis [Palleronia aestuarii]|uniref:Glycosyltransferase involved in cell wall biosynthesis n=1 Tax=Palleronia aestuarii TaxID=568105 RepID=A0A2W7NJY2_9RHOB|nr:glycosyltransferase [Palleronia aestuarii]PZX13496.1 glycosyltransferase involved in cell wall biosynthesis [Palleronia aestuarii]